MADATRYSILRLIPLVLAIVHAGPAFGRQQVDPSRLAFENTMAVATAEQWGELDLGDVMQRVGLRFIGRPYEAGLLDAPESETLVAPLDRFDCVLFVEAVLAISRGIVAGDPSHDGYLRRIEEQRYRDGTMDGYCSRLHYFSEWISVNEARGLVTNITSGIGGQILEKRLTFMGRNRSSYRQLATSDSLFAGIQAMERDLADLEIQYVPKAAIRRTYGSLRAGDIVALATSIDGLDVVHTGLVYDAADGRKGLLHASLTRGVVVSPDLQSYVENNRSQIGIVVARPTDGRTGH